LIDDVFLPGSIAEVVVVFEVVFEVVVVVLALS
jgi:hypothetical protein